MRHASGCFPILFATSALLTFLVLPFTVQAAPDDAAFSLHGLEQGDWLIRLQATSVIPMKASSHVALVGGRVETPSTLLPTLDVGYFLTDHWSVELAGGVLSTDYRLKDSLLGDLDAGSIKSATVSLVAQYHFRPDAPLNPYLGAGVNHTRPIDTDPAKGIPDFDANALTSPLIDIGMDYRLSSHWFANANVRYLMLPTQHFESDDFKAELDANVLTVGAGMGFRF